MEVEGLTKQQRYYMRHREELCRKRRERYHNDPECNKREKEYSSQYKKEHPFETYLAKKRHRERKRNIVRNDNVD